MFDGKGIGEGINAMVKFIIGLLILVAVLIVFIVYLVIRNSDLKEEQSTPQKSSWITPQTQYESTYYL